MFNKIRWKTCSKCVESQQHHFLGKFTQKNSAARGSTEIEQTIASNIPKAHAESWWYWGKKVGYTIHMLTADLFLLRNIRFRYSSSLPKLHQNCHIFTSNVCYFHHKCVLSICFVEKVPKCFRKWQCKK